jgi:hypothetical protein
MVRDPSRPRTARRLPALRMLRLGLSLSTAVVLSHSAISQEVFPVAPFSTSIEVAPNTIEFIPPLAKAVISGDTQQVNRLLETEDVNDPIRAKKGERAGFTPLMLAAALSDAGLAQTLIKRGAKITNLDDFHRSAFWYAAMHENVELTGRADKCAGRAPSYKYRRQ